MNPTPKNPAPPPTSPLAKNPTPPLTPPPPSPELPARGRRRSAMLSRARKMRERTVPIGQFITVAISS